MARPDITQELTDIRTSGDDFEYLSGRLTEKWKNEPSNPEAVELILKFMEANPNIDYGTPGPLVHFLETFSDYYEENLLQSVEAHPTPHTVWMLNRVINGKAELFERQNLSRTFKRILENSAVDAATRERADEYWQWQIQRST